MVSQKELFLKGIPPQDRGGWLEVFAELSTRKKQELADALEAFPAKLDPDTAPDAWLPGLLRVVGWPLALQTPYAQRRVLKKIPAWLKTLGQVGVYEEIVAYHLQPTSSTTPPTITLTPRKSSQSDLHMGTFYMGNTYMWDAQSRWEIIVNITNPGSYTLDNDLRGQIKRVLEAVSDPLFAWVIQ
jgi:hypothetical protein